MWWYPLNMWWPFVVLQLPLLASISCSCYYLAAMTDMASGSVWTSPNSPIDSNNNQSSSSSAAQVLVNLCSVWVVEYVADGVYHRTTVQPTAVCGVHLHLPTTKRSQQIHSWWHSLLCYAAACTFSRDKQIVFFLHSVWTFQKDSDRQWCSQTNSDNIRHILNHCQHTRVNPKNSLDPLNWRNWTFGTRNWLLSFYMQLYNLVLWLEFVGDGHHMFVSTNIFTSPTNPILISPIPMSYLARVKK